MNRLKIILVLILGIFLLTPMDSIAQTNPYGNIFNSTTIKSKCSAFTQSGYQCSRSAKDGDMYCSQHTRSNREQGLEPAANDCMGTTKSGRACRNKAKNGMYCGHHDPEKKILGKLD